MAGIVAEVAEIICTQEDVSRTHASIRETASELNIGNLGKSSLVSP